MASFEVPARQYMSSPLQTAHVDDTLDEVHDRMRDLEISALPIRDDDDHVVGLISRSDLLRIGERQSSSRPGAPLLVLPKRTAGREMTEDPVSVPGDAPLSRVAQIMRAQGLHRVFVREGEEIVGVVTTRDLMRAIAEKQVNHPISRYMNSPVFTIRATEPVSMGTERLQQAGVSGLVVVDDDWPVGVYAQPQALAARGLSRETPVQDVMSAAILLLHADLPVYRAADQAATMGARRVVATRDEERVGIMGGLDFASVVA
jgi:CBS domain-containing protein